MKAEIKLINMARQGYQNIVNVVNEDPEEDSSFMSVSSSSFPNPLSGFLTEEQLQYSSYYNTYFERRRSRNTNIALAVISVFVFFALMGIFDHKSPETEKTPTSPSVSTTTSTSLASNADTAASNMNMEPVTTKTSTSTSTSTGTSTVDGATTDWSSKPLADQEVHFSNVANNRFREQTAKTSKSVQSGCEGTILIMTACEKDSFSSNQLVHQHCNYVGFERAQYLPTLFGSNIITTDRRRRNRRKLTQESSMLNRNMEQTAADTTNSTNASAMSLEEEEEVFIESTVVAEEVAELEIDALLTLLSIKWPVPSFLYALSPSHRLTNPETYIYRELETLTPLSEQFNVPIHQEFTESTTSTDALTSDLFGKLTSGAMCGKIAVIAWNHEYIPELAQSLGCGPLQGCPLQYDKYTYDDVWSIKYVYRPNSINQLMLGEDQNTFGMYQGWEMFASVVKQGFDPLRFSGENMDYDGVEGVPVGGNWIATPM